VVQAVFGAFRHHFVACSAHCTLKLPYATTQDAASTHGGPTRHRPPRQIEPAEHCDEALQPVGLLSSQ
jgi:hypothetical protein